MADRKIPPEKQRSRRLPVVAVLLLAALLTSALVGYALGRLAGADPRGELVDTIVMAPTEKKLLLTGVLGAESGKPAAGVRLRLHSDPMETTTNAAGVFTFLEVDRAKHTLDVLDGDGKVQVSCGLSLRVTEGSEKLAITPEGKGGYGISMSKDVRLIDLALKLGASGEAPKLDSTKVAYLTDTGVVVTPSGRTAIGQGAVLLPGGTVVTPAGFVVLPEGSTPSGKVVVDAQGKVVEQSSAGTTLSDGTVIEKEGSITLTSGTKVATDGTVTLRDGTTLKDEGAGLQIDDKGNTKAIEGDMQTSEKAAQTPAAPTAPPAIAEAPIAPVPPFTPIPTPAVPIPNPTPQPTPIPTPNPTPNPIPTPDKGVAFYHGTTKDTLISWEQQATVDLFYNRTSGISDTGLLAPGASGYYLFALDNDNSFGVNFTVALTASGAAIPMEYRIADNLGRGLTPWASDTAGTPSERIYLAARKNVIYRLEWRWPYEGNDAADMAAGLSENRKYTVNLTIRADQV